MGLILISPKGLNLQVDLIDKLKARATSAPKLSSKFIKSNFASLETAFLIRAVEMALLIFRLTGFLRRSLIIKMRSTVYLKVLKKIRWMK